MRSSRCVWTIPPGKTAQHEVIGSARIIFQAPFFLQDTGGMQPHELRTMRQVFILICRAAFEEADVPVRCSSNNCSKRISAARRPISSTGCWITLIDGRTVEAS